MSRFGTFYHKAYNQELLGDVLSETDPIQLPPQDDEEFIEESLLANTTSEELVSRIGRLGLMSRHFFILGNEVYSRDLQLTISLYEKVLAIRGDEALLEIEGPKQQTSDGRAKGILGHL